MAYKYKLNPITGKLDLVGGEGEGGGSGVSITSSDQSITINNPTEGVFDITAPSLTMLEGYECGFGSSSATGNAKFCDLYWSTNGYDSNRIFTVTYKRAIGSEYILLHAQIQLIFGALSGGQICDIVISDEVAYLSNLSIESYLEDSRISKHIKLDYIKNATNSSAHSAPTKDYGHACLFFINDVRYGGNILFVPLSAKAIRPTIFNLMFFTINPECVGTAICSQYTPQGTIKDAKVVAPNYYTKTEIDTKIGNIETLLNKI